MLINVEWMNLLDVCQFIIHMNLNSTEGNFEQEVI